MKNKPEIAPASSDIVIGSVDGVKTAPASAASNTTQRQAESIRFQRTNPNKPSSSCRTGN
jgi:hypothetical protein